jgi:hypothetical protein
MVVDIAADGEPRRDRLTFYCEGHSTQDRRVLIKPWNIGDRTQREPPGCNYINFRMKFENAG